MKSIFKKFRNKIPASAGMTARADGFTLVELIVILSIFAIMASVALFNFNGFRSNVDLENLAQDVALTIRQAQVFGWSAESSTNSTGLVLDSSGNPVRTINGVYFPFDSTNGIYQRQFLLYSKILGPGSVGSYVQGDDINDTIKIQGPSHISDIRTSGNYGDLLLKNNIPVGGTPLGATGSSVDVSVAFSRPNPEAMIFEGASDDPSVQYVGIYIAADSDPVGTADHVIIVSRLGEIEVN